eukprot:TRINITY_DN14518_c0_g1_i1.p1 TRINITY_DN14518_c0_g1~~TRINITY_DN14518_c0_g1_i1.p1  ORF type:complete len:950 (-),score=275.55 TRINITY_DN14518_c0_g1_i1:80-2707(-)
MAMINALDEADRPPLPVDTTAEEKKPTAAAISPPDTRRAPKLESAVPTSPVAEPMQVGSTATASVPSSGGDLRQQLLDMRRQLAQMEQPQSTSAQSPAPAPLDYASLRRNLQQPEPTRAASLSASRIAPEYDPQQYQPYAQPQLQQPAAATYSMSSLLRTAGQASDVSLPVSADDEYHQYAVPVAPVPQQQRSSSGAAAQHSYRATMIEDGAGSQVDNYSWALPTDTPSAVFRQQQLNDSVSTPPLRAAPGRPAQPPPVFNRNTAETTRTAPETGSEYSRTGRSDAAAEAKTASTRKEDLYRSLPPALRAAAEAVAAQPLSPYSKTNGSLEHSYAQQSATSPAGTHGLQSWLASPPELDSDEALLPSAPDNLDISLNFAASDLNSSVLPSSPAVQQSLATPPASALASRSPQQRYQQQTLAMTATPAAFAALAMSEPVHNVPSSASPQRDVLSPSQQQRASKGSPLQMDPQPSPPYTTMWVRPPDDDELQQQQQPPQQQSAMGLSPASQLSANTSGLRRHDRVAAMKEKRAQRLALNTSESSDSLSMQSPLQQSFTQPSPQQQQVESKIAVSSSAQSSPYGSAKPQRIDGSPSQQREELSQSYLSQQRSPPHHQSPAKPQQSYSASLPSPQQQQQQTSPAKHRDAIADSMQPPEQQTPQAEDLSQPPAQYQRTPVANVSPPSWRSRDTVGAIALSPQQQQQQDYGQSYSSALPMDQHRQQQQHSQREDKRPQQSVEDKQHVDVIPTAQSQRMNPLASLARDISGARQFEKEIAALTQRVSDLESELATALQLSEERLYLLNQAEQQTKQQHDADELAAQNRDLSDQLGLLQDMTAALRRQQRDDQRKMQELEDSNLQLQQALNDASDTIVGLQSR